MRTDADRLRRARLKPRSGCRQSRPSRPFAMQAVRGKGSSRRKLPFDWLVQAGVKGWSMHPKEIPGGRTSIFIDCDSSCSSMDASGMALDVARRNADVLDVRSMERETTRNPETRSGRPPETSSRRIARPRIYAMLDESPTDACLARLSPHNIKTESRSDGASVPACRVLLRRPKTIQDELQLAEEFPGSGAKIHDARRSQPRFVSLFSG